jgi:uncharacterized DUF497 family protein
VNLRVSGFDWDEGNRGKCQKHGLSIAQIEATIRTKGRSRLIRPVTARYMHAEEIEAYEKDSAANEDR